MKHLKLYEELFKYKPTPEPKSGDFVLASDFNTINGTVSDDFKEITNFIQTHIGKFLRKDSSAYVVEYKIPTELYEEFYNFDFKALTPQIDDTFLFDMRLEIEETTYWSDNYEELKILIQANKYNI